MASAISTGTPRRATRTASRVDVTTHRNLRKSLIEAGLDEATAEADIKALHQGRVLVLVQTDTRSHEALVAPRRSIRSPSVSAGAACDGSRH
jgi:hypothetical protein